MSVAAINPSRTTAVTDPTRDYVMHIVHGRYPESVLTAGDQQFLQRGFAAGHHQHTFFLQGALFSLARRGAQCEQALFDPFELLRIVFGDPQRLFEMDPRLIERGERRIDRLDRRLDQRRRLRGATFQTAYRGR